VRRQRLRVEDSLALERGAVLLGKHENLLGQAQRGTGWQRVRMLRESEELKNVVTPRQNSIAGRSTEKAHFPPPPKRPAR
jgi:hypothetical protein